MKTIENNREEYRKELNNLIAQCYAKIIKKNAKYRNFLFSQCWECKNYGTSLNKTICPILIEFIETEEVPEQIKEVGEKWKCKEYARIGKERSK